MKRRRRDTSAGKRRTNAALASVLLAVCCGACHRDLSDVEAMIARQSAAMTQAQPVDETPSLHAVSALQDRSQPKELTVWTDDLSVGGVLTAESARRVALKSNPDIHAALARIAQMIAQVREAQASYYPTITLGHTSGRTFQVPSSRNRISVPSAQPVPDIPANLQQFDVSTILSLLTSPLFQQNRLNGISSSFSQHTTSLTATWTIFDGFTREATVLANKFAQQAASMSLLDVQRVLMQAVDSEYFQGQLAHEQLRIARADVAFSEQQLSSAERRQEVGKGRPGDVSNFQVRLRKAEAEVVNAQGMLTNARTLLAELMGIEGAQLPDDVRLAALDDETVEQRLPPDPDEWIDLARTRRPDLAQKDLELRSKREEINALKGQFSPSLGVTGSYAFDKLSDMSYSENDQASSAALEMRWPLYTGGARTARVRLAQKEADEIRAELRSLRIHIDSQVRQSMTNVVNSIEEVRFRQESLGAANENRDIVAAEYDAGKTSVERLNQAQRDLIEADAALVAARIRLRQAWTDLHAAAATPIDAE